MRLEDEMRSCPSSDGTPVTGQSQCLRAHSCRCWTGAGLLTRPIACIISRGALSPATRTHIAGRVDFVRAVAHPTSRRVRCNLGTRESQARPPLLGRRRVAGAGSRGGSTAARPVDQGRRGRARSACRRCGRRRSEGSAGLCRPAHGRARQVRAGGRGSRSRRAPRGPTPSPWRGGAASGPVIAGSHRLKAADSPASPRDPS